MDRIEQTIRRNSEEALKKDKRNYNLLFALAVAFGIYAFISAIGIFFSLAAGGDITFWSVLPLIVSAVIAALCFFKKDDMLLEYDYTVEDDCLIIAKIKNLSSRKEVLNLPVNKIKRIEAFNEKRFKALDTKKLDFSLNEPNEKQILFFEQGEMTAMVFEPNEALLKMLVREINK